MDEDSREIQMDFGNATGRTWHGQIGGGKWKRVFRSSLISFGHSLGQETTNGGVK